MANKYRSEVDVSILQDGMTLRYTMVDLATLSDPNVLGESYFTDALNLCEMIKEGVASATVGFLELLKHGLRNSEGKKPTKGDMDMLLESTEALPIELAPLVQDALCLTTNGKNFAEYLKFNDERLAQAEAEAAKGKPNPTEAANVT